MQNFLIEFSVADAIFQTEVYHLIWTLSESKIIKEERIYLEKNNDYLI